jgi:hypothetical protein
MDQCASEQAFANAAAEAMRQFGGIIHFTAGDLVVSAGDTDLTDEATARMYSAVGCVHPSLRMDGSIQRLRSKQEWSSGHLQIEVDSVSILLLFGIRRDGSIHLDRLQTSSCTAG